MDGLRYMTTSIRDPPLLAPSPPDPGTVARPAVSDASFQDVTGMFFFVAAVRRNHGISWVLWAFYGISWDILEISGFLWVFDGIFWRYLMMYPLVMIV